MENRMYHVEVYEEDGQKMCFISTDSSSGCKYPINSPEDVGPLLVDYIASYDIKET